MPEGQGTVKRSPKCAGSEAQKFGRYEKFFSISEKAGRKNWGGEKCRGHAQEYGGDGLKNAEGMRRDWVHGAEKM